MELVWNILLALLAALGLTEVIRLLALKIAGAGRCGQIIMLVPLSGHQEDVEYVLRSAAQRLKWTDGKEGGQIYCLDYGMDKETLEICKIMAKEYAFMQVVTPDQLGERMSAQGLQIVK